MKFSGFLDGYRYLKMRDGVNSLWNGFFLGAVTYGVEFCEDEIKKYIFKMDDYIPKEDDEPTPGRVKKYFLGNFFSRLAIQLLTFPLENIWVRIITDVEPVSKYTGIIDCVQKVFKKEGFHGFYSGFVFAFCQTLLKASFKTLSYYLRLKTEVGCPKSPLMYPFTAAEQVILFAVDTLKVRSIVGLPLVSKNVTGLGIIADVYSGLSVEMISIITELIVLKAYSIISVMSLNELPNFIV